MSSGADLFVVCKQCGSEVSPYITECPYCGSRLRKRAPKLEKARKQEERRRRRADAPRLGRLRSRRDPRHPRRHASLRDHRPGAPERRRRVRCVQLGQARSTPATS